MDETSLKDRGRHMKIAVVGVVCLVIGATLGFGIIAWEPWEDKATEEATGERTLHGVVMVKTYNDDGCWGPWRTNDTWTIREGTEVTVKDESGETLGHGALGPAALVIRPFGLEMGLEEGEPWTGSIPFSYSGYRCQYEFEIPELPKAGLYFIEVGNREGEKVSYLYLESTDWTVELQLD